jgi:ADP-heptose:LPS heptosyltransferase
MSQMLVLHPGALGDILLGLPLFDSLKKKFPSRKLVVSGQTDYLALLEGSFVDEVRSTNLSAPLFVEGVAEKELEIFKSFDPIISFLSDPEEIVSRNLARAAGGQVICSGWSRNLTVHASEHFLRIAAPVIKGVLTPPPSASLLQGLKMPRPAWLEKNKKLAVIHPGSGSRLKCWPEEYFNKVIGRLDRSSHLQVLVILGPAEAGFIPPAASQIYRNRGLADVAAAIKCADVFLGNDSGITHLAAMMGVPTVAVFGPTDPRIWGPRNQNVKILHDPPHCSPCRAFGPAECTNKTDRACLKRISPEKVLDSLAAAIQSFPTKNSRGNPIPAVPF